MKGAGEEGAHVPEDANGAAAGDVPERLAAEGEDGGWDGHGECHSDRLEFGQPPADEAIAGEQEIQPGADRGDGGDHTTAVRMIETIPTLPASHLHRRIGANQEFAAAASRVGVRRP